MLILELLSACLAVFFSIHPILVVGASEQCSALGLLDQPFTPEIAKSIKCMLDKFPGQTESYLRMAIETNNTKAAECIISHANQGPKFIMLLRNIYNRRSLSMYDDQDPELDDSKFAKLMSKEIISAIDLGYLLGLEGLIRLLVQWKLKSSNGSTKPIEGNENKILSILIGKSLDMSAKNKYGESILHIACRLDKPKIVKLLLARYEKHRTEIVVNMLIGQKTHDDTIWNTVLYINGQDKHMWTPLHCACAFGSLELVVLLLTIPEIDVNIQNKWGRTPIMVASDGRNWEIAEYLLTKEGLNVDTKDNDGNTLLHIVCEKGRLEIVNKLVEHYKVDVNIQNRQGRTPIMEASCWRKWDVVERLLTRQDLSVNAKNNNGSTLLHFACEKGQLEIVKQLLTNYKVDINIQNKKGKTAMEIAKDKGYSDILRLFENHMSD